MAIVTRDRGTAREIPAESSIGADQSRLAIKIARLTAMARSVYRDDQRLQLALFAVMLLLYGSLLGISWRMRYSANLTFNSMLEHLLHGRFDVDPSIIGDEGFLRDGRVYAYWGIWCALLRLPLWIFRRMDVDLTLWSSLAAACLAGMAKVRAVLLLRRHGANNSVSQWAIGLMLAYVLLGGSAVAYLGVSIYQEVILWAYAFAAIFVYLALKGLVLQKFDTGTLSSMALCAGLCLLTRISTGIGLVLAMMLLLLMLAVNSGTTQAGGRWTAIPRFRRALFEPRIVVSLGILAALGAAAGTVNYFRWGSPIVAANYNLYLSNHYMLPSMRMYGLFNLKRIPFGLVYYFLPIWVLHGSNGQLLFDPTQTRLIDFAELPPSSFFFTDLLPLCFIALLAIALWRRRAGALRHMGQPATAVAIGLLAPCILILSAIDMSYRYRMEFYPEIDFLAFLGLYSTVIDERMLATFARYRKWMTVGLTVSIVSSFLALSLYNLSDYGPAQETLRPGIVRYYSNEVAKRYHRATAHFPY